ncbi:MAG TPA: DoxX family protein [Kofleriaceae bacterium]|nr:DoxX family protein [Kofleriaceae bacterium]
MLTTGDSRMLMFQRIVLGGVMFPHGAQKLLGWFGGGGWDRTMQTMTQQMHMPAALAALVIAIEVFGSLALIAGLFTRVSAAGIAAVMIGAVALVNHRFFFVDWGDQQGGEGYEYHLLALALALPLIVRGGGAFSLDRVLSRRLRALRLASA